MLNFQEKAIKVPYFTQHALRLLPGFYSQAFNLALETNPELANIDIDIGSKDRYPVLQFTAGFMADPLRSSRRPKIVLSNPTDVEFSQLLVDRYWTMRHISEKLAVPFSTFRTQPELFYIHVFLHELGHVDEYLDIASKTPHLKYQPDEPAKAFLFKRIMEMRDQPVPMEVQKVIKDHKSGSLGNYFEENRAYLAKLGIGSINDLLKAQETAYVNSPMEARAHDFAAELIKSNWDRLGIELPD